MEFWIMMIVFIVMGGRNNKNCSFVKESESYNGNDGGRRLYAERTA